VTGRRRVFERRKVRGGWKDLELTGAIRRDCLWRVSNRRRDSGRQIQYVTRGETAVVGGWLDPAR
jgi:hypothetical protein